MSCFWCAYSCSEVRRLLGQVQGFSPLRFCCHSWNNWLDYRHLACFTPAFHSKAAFSPTLTCFFFTPLHWDVKEQEMQKVWVHLYVCWTPFIYNIQKNCTQLRKTGWVLFVFILLSECLLWYPLAKMTRMVFFNYVLYSYAGLHLSLKWQHGENVSLREIKNKKFKI